MGESGEKIYQNMDFKNDIIGKHSVRTRQNERNVIKELYYLISMEYPMTSHPTKRRKNGKSASCLWHIKVWIEANGEIPKGHIIHHINGDKWDYSLENLECLSRRDHALKHSNKKIVPRVLPPSV